MAALPLAEMWALVMPNLLRILGAVVLLGASSLLASFGATAVGRLKGVFFKGRG